MGTIKKKYSLICCEVNGSRFAVSLDMIEGVAQLPDVVAVPTNTSRVFRGVAYILGQLMSVVDIAPLFNLGTATSARQVLILQIEGEFYALAVDTIGDIVSVPELTKYQHALSPAAPHYIEVKKNKIPVLESMIVMQRFVCS